MAAASSNPSSFPAMEKYGTMVYRICFLYMKNKADAEDAFQDVFLRHLEAHRLFFSEEHEKAWLCTVAFNRCKDLLRRSARGNVSIDEVEEPAGPDNSSPRSDVLEAVLQLPAKYKDVIYLHYYEGYSSRQIARILKCTENTIYSQLSRARGLLKERLGDEFED